MPGHTRAKKSVLFLLGIIMVLHILAHETVGREECSADQSIDCERDPKYYVKISKPPDMVQLQTLNFFDEMVQDDLSKFGTLLLNDEFDNIVSAIRKQSQLEAYEISRMICKRWLKGPARGLEPLPATWNTLIDVLKKISLNMLADKLLASIEEDVLDTPAVPYAHTDCIMDIASTLKEHYKTQQFYERKIKISSGDTLDIPFLNVTLQEQLILSSDILVYKKYTSQKLLEKMINSDSYQRLMITGQPGVGKSRLMLHFAKEWANGNALQSCQILFLLELSSIRSEKPSSLTDLLNMYSYKDYHNCEIKEITDKAGAGACFLLDDYEEQDPPTFVDFLIKGNELHSSLCIITSRSRSHYFSSRHKHVELLGFDSNDLDNYLAKFTYKDQVITSIKDIWKAHPNIKEMCTLPLHLEMIVAIIAYGGKHTPQTKTQIYTGFMNLTIKCYNDLHKMNAPSLRQCILRGVESNHDEVCSAFQKLHSIAFKMHFNKQLTFPEPKLNFKNIIKEFGFVTVTDEGSSSGEVRYEFSHLTFLEFFSALHLTTLPLDQQLHYILLYGNDLSSHNVWSFFWGLLGDFSPHFSSIIPQLLKRFSMHYTHQLTLDIFQIKTPFFDFLLETGLPHKKLCHILKTENVINSALSVRQFGLSNEQNRKFIKFLLGCASVNDFRINIVTLRGHLSISLERSCMDFLDREYETLISFLNKSSDSVGTTFPSVSAIKAPYHHLLAYNQKKNFANLRSLHITDSLMKEKLTQLQSKFELGSLERLRLSIPCTNFTTIAETLVSVKHLHLELINCNAKKIQHSNELNKHDQVESSQVHPSKGNDSELTNFSGLQALTIDPVKDVGMMTRFVGLPNLQHLYLHSVVSINESNIDQFIEGLNQSWNLLTLSLEVKHINLGKSGFEKLYKHLPHSLQVLILKGSNFTYYHMEDLSEALKRLTNLRSLSLLSNHTMGRDLKVLVEALKTLKHFHSLDLSYQISSLVCEEEVDTLHELTNLHHLKIQGCQLPLTTKDSLNEMLDNLVELRSLHLEFFEDPIHIQYNISVQKGENVWDILNWSDTLGLCKRFNSSNPSDLFIKLLNDPAQLLHLVHIYSATMVDPSDLELKIQNGEFNESELCKIIFMGDPLDICEKVNVSNSLDLCQKLSFGDPLNICPLLESALDETLNFSDPLKLSEKFNLSDPTDLFTNPTDFLDLLYKLNWSDPLNLSKKLNWRNPMDMIMNLNWSDPMDFLEKLSESDKQDLQMQLNLSDPVGTCKKILWGDPLDICTKINFSDPLDVCRKVNLGDPLGLCKYVYSKMYKILHRQLPRTKVMIELVDYSDDELLTDQRWNDDDLFDLFKRLEKLPHLQYLRLIYK